MNIIRKLKFNNIHPVEFTQDEVDIIKLAEKTILSLHSGITPDYYGSKYHNHIYYMNSEGNVVIYRKIDESQIYIYKPFLHTLSNSINHTDYLEDSKKIDAMAKTLSFYFKKYHLKNKEFTRNIFASNFLDDIMKKGWSVTTNL